MNDTDISTQIRKIREHRFTGYTNAMLADEIETFRSGQGGSGVGDAVAALEAVADALAATDDTLRTELAKLGVEWSGDAGTAARNRLSDDAEFSSKANKAVSDTSARVFAQGESFSRTLHRLPDPAILRADVDGEVPAHFSSLLGQEADNTRKVEQLREARTQAVVALNDYAKDSGENLTGLPELGSPGKIGAVVPPTVPESIDVGGGQEDTTTAASASGPVPQSAPEPAPANGTTNSPVPAPVPFSGAATRPIATGSPASTAPSAPTAPSAVSGTGTAASSGAATGTGAPTAVGGSRQTERYAPQPGPVQSGQSPAGQPQGQASGQAPGQAQSGRSVPRATPGTSVPEVSDRAPKYQSGVPGTGTGQNLGSAPGSGTTAKPGTPGSSGHVAAPGQSLAKGMSSGAVRPQPTSAPGFGTAAGGASVGRGFSANDIGGGVTAAGAAGAAGALSGGDDSRGRGVGRSAPGAARSPQDLPIGDLPEEEERVRRRSDQLGDDAAPPQEEFLERAVPGEEEGGDHVRRHAVTDTDLFGDERMVAPDLIGEDRTDGRR